MGRIAAGFLAFWLLASAAWAEGRWVGSWASSQQVPEPHNALPEDDLRDMTLRQVVRLTLSGERVRVRLSNAFGTEPLRVDDVHVALSDGGRTRIVEASSRAVTFGGESAILIPAGADYLSDPVDLPVEALASVAVTMHLPEPPARQTSHPGSRISSWLKRGVHGGAVDLEGAKPVDHWYQLAAVDVERADAKAAAIALIGDSITDGFGVRGGVNTRWPDFLANRLQADAATRHLAVLNHGIGGGRVLLDGLGPNALARFERDVLSQAGVRFLLIYEGVNDLGTLTRDAPATAEQHALVKGITGAFAQMVKRAREKGIKVIGGTIIPFGGHSYYRDAANEADRQAVNAWIRAPGNFDAVVDFDAAVRDPARPERMRADLDSGDGLHPSIRGYAVMAAAVPVELFE